MSRDRDEPEEMSERQQFISFYRLNNSLDAAAGATPNEFDALQEDERIAWVSAFENAKRIAQEGEGKTFAELGRQLGESFLCSLNSESPTPWDAITPAMQLKWAMLIRHTVELLTWTTLDPDIQSTESWIVDVFRENLPPTPEVQ